MDGVGGAGVTGRARKPKSSSLLIGSGDASGVDCPDVEIDSTRLLGVYSLSLSSKTSVGDSRVSSV